jgi:hypothetical protein
MGSILCMEFAALCVFYLAQGSVLCFLGLWALSMVARKW